MNAMTAWLDEHFQEIGARDFYRGIFPAGQLDREGAFTRGKYTGIIVAVTKDRTSVGKRRVLRYSLTDDLNAVDVATASDDFCICAPIAYAGKARTALNARMLYAIAVDVDKLKYNKDGTPAGLLNMWKQMDKAHFLPKPTYIVSSGTGLHLYYVLKDPLPLFDNVAREMQELKRELTEKIWNGIIVDIQGQKEIQQEGIYQGFRMPGTVTKTGERVRAFVTGGKVTIEYLNEFISDLNKAKKAAQLKKRGKVSRAEAAEKWPEWYDRRVVKGEPRGSWHINRALYDWWKGQILTGATVGHRYYCVMMLAVYAKKCGMYDAKHNPNPVTEEELQQDAYSLVQILDGITETEDNHFGADDVQAALQAYQERWITFPRQAIADKTGIQIRENKRNGRKQKDHIRYMNWVREELNENHDWHGRKPAGDIVREWQAENLYGKRADCVKETGLDSDTVGKYWVGSTGDIVAQWRQENPAGTKADCVRATGLTKPTVYKYWQSAIEAGQPAAAAQGDVNQSGGAASDSKHSESTKDRNEEGKQKPNQIDEQIKMFGDLLAQTKSILDRMDSSGERLGMDEGEVKDNMRRDYEKILEAYEAIKRGQDPGNE